MNHTADTGNAPAAAEAGRNIDLGTARDLLATMERIRAFEERAVAAAERKLVLGAIHPSIGQEAIAAGIVGALRRDDVLLSTHRGHGHTLAKGTDALAMMRELLGREGGTCGGKGGSMHIADFGVGMLGANGVVSANIVIAAGAAHAIKLHRGPAGRGTDGRGTDERIVCCVFGDGAVNRGPFLEGLNWAAVFALPIVFVCEDNRYSATTLTSDMTGGEGPAARARALGLHVSEVDGNDALACAELGEAEAARVRGGGAPGFVLARTYRQTGHTSSDLAAYRPAGESDGMRDTNDPIARLRDALTLAGVAADEIDRAREVAQAEMAQVLAEAEASPWPADETAFADVQDVGSPLEEAY